MLIPIISNMTGEDSKNSPPFIGSQRRPEPISATPQKPVRPHRAILAAAKTRSHYCPSSRGNQPAATENLEPIS